VRKAAVKRAPTLTHTDGAPVSDGEMHTHDGPVRYVIRDVEHIGVLTWVLTDDGTWRIMRAEAKP
jgi:hypothetical protein